MTSLGIQNDYGGFDPTFFGVTLRMQLQSWDLFDQFHGPQRDPARVVDIGNQALKSGHEKAFEVFSSGTVLLHELRHFHDNLLSPLGNHIFRLRTVAAINGVQVVGRLRDQSHVLPVPMAKWEALTSSEQFALLRQWEAMTGKPVAAPRYDLDGDDVIMLGQVKKAYELIRDLVKAPSTGPNEYQPFHLLEGSAIAAQTNHVYTVFGVAHADLFLNHVLHHPSARSYALVLRVWLSLCEEHDCIFDSDIFSAAVVWTFLGDYTTEGWAACPTERFARLVAVLKRNGVPANDKPIIEHLDRWSDLTNTGRVYQAIERATVANKRQLARVRAIVDATGNYFTELLSVFSGFVHAQEELSRQFMASPDTYIRPHAYAEVGADWVAAPIRFDFPDRWLVGDKDKLSRMLDVRSAKELSNGQLAVRRALLPSQTTGREFVNTKDAAGTLDLMNLVDFFFAEFRRDEPDFDLARQTIAETGAMAFEIL